MNDNTSQDYIGRMYTRFKVLVAEKEIRDGRKYTYDDIKVATGIARSTLSAYAQNKPSVKAYKKATLAKLCIFFDCDLGDLIVFERK
jgi:DNA-binding Xre family transcriptional regulator